MPARRPVNAALQAQARDDFSRPVKLHVCKDKTITYRREGEPVFNGIALPFFSVDTVEEAEALQIMSCARQYAEHPQMPGKTWYRLSGFEFGPTLEVEDIDRVTALFRERYKLVKEQLRVLPYEPDSADLEMMGR